MEIKSSRNAIVLGSNGGLRDMVRSNLKGLGFSVLESTPSAKLALERLSDANVTCGLIISEVSLDGASCKSFLAELRTMPDFDATMIFLLASEHESEELEACLEFGIAGIIRKPFSNDAFPELLQAPYTRLKFLNESHKALFLSTFSAYCDAQCRYKSAIRYLEKSIRLSEAAISHFELGRLYLKVSNLPIAEQHFQKSIALNASFKAPANKSIAIFRSENPAEDAALASAIQTFPTPLNQFRNSCYGIQKVKKALVLGGTHLDRVAVKNFLVNLGVKQVSMHESVDAALKILRDCNVNLVVSWLRIGKSDSLALTKALRKIYSSREMKILVIADQQETKELAQVLEAGADGYFVPPFVAENFCQRLHRCLVLQDLCLKSGASAQFARAAHAMFETDNFVLGEKAAEKGLALNSDDAVCRLFHAMNLHLQLQTKKAYAEYDCATSLMPALGRVVSGIRAQLDIVAAQMELQRKVAEAAKIPKPKPASQSHAPGNGSNKYAVGNTPQPSSNEEDPDADPATAPLAVPGVGDAAASSLAEFDLSDEDGEESENRPAEPAKKRRRMVAGADELAVVTKLEEDDVKLGAAGIEKVELPVEAKDAQRGTASDSGSVAPPADDADQQPSNPPSTSAGAVLSPAIEPPKEDPKKTEMVRRQRLKIRNESLGKFSSLAEMQQELFGRTEPMTSEVLIPKSLLAQGISEVDLVQPLGVEPVFGGAVPSVSSSGGFGKIRVIEESVVPWLPTEALASMKFSPVGKPNSVGNAANEKGASSPPSGNHGQVIQIAEQAQLLNSRIICLPDKNAGTQSFHAYLSILGKVVAEKNLVSTFALEDKLDSRTRKLIEDVKRDSSNSEVNRQLGDAIVSASIADGIFRGMSSSTQSEDVRRISEESLSELQAPIVDFHRECLQGKKEFENKLPYVLESIAAGKVEFEMLYKVMDEDHNSFESFKKIYFALAKAKRPDELERFFNARHKHYLANEKSTEALQRLLLATGDVRRLKQIGPKASVDEMKRMALEWYQKNDLEMAITLCRRLVSRDAHLEFAYNLMGVAYRKMGKLPEAIDAYEKGIELEPNSIKLHHNISLAFGLAGNTVKAKEEASIAVALRKKGGENAE